MRSFDPSQLAALALDPARHARILGAPGSGKTSVLIEQYARLLEQGGRAETEVLAVAPNRLVASRLRADIEHRVSRALGGTPVRTAASLAFAVLARSAAQQGLPAPRLLTGTVQDEAAAAVIEARIASGRSGGGALTPEVLRSPAFRAELRELWRVLDDFGREPEALLRELAAARGAGASGPHTDAPPDELVGRWAEGVEIIAEIRGRLAAERPEELSSSAMLRAAARIVRTGAIGVPRILLVDDAQELGEGQLALLAACAGAGSSVWAFGDPDIATGAFQGERPSALARLSDELARRGGRGAAAEPEQFAVLGAVHRQGGGLREFVAALTGRIGAAGAGAQRAARGAARESGGRRDDVCFAATGSPAEQIGVVAHRMRSRRLGLDGGEPLPWGRMAVVCRSRADAARISRGLASHQVPSGVAAGGMVLREHQIVRELVRLLQYALGIRALDADEVLQLAGGVVGGLDPVAVRRLRGALVMQERRDALAEEREPEAIDAVVLEAFALPGGTPIVDTAGGRALRRLGLLAAEAVRTREAGGTARETLWALWDRTRLAERWQEEALEGRGARADEAHRSLDAVTGLFFALQRHEEQDSEQPIAELLDEILQSAVPEDTLAQRSEREAVTVTTPQGVIGREFALVAVIGAQDGAWPNLRARGSLLGTAALERWLRGGEAIAPSRRDTMHDELRLFAQACSRAAEELLVVAVSDEDHHPGPFFGFGRDHLSEGLPSARLTLRGATAAMRRRLAEDPSDTGALVSLAALAEHGVPGAHPDDWYGVLPPSSSAPLHDLDGDPELRVPVSPSQLERAETCPLDWAVSALGGGSGSVQASLGTLAHHALETAEGHDPEPLFEAMIREWRKLPFDADWESERMRRTARVMAEGLAGYLREFDASDRRLLGRESGFAVPLGRAELRGIADRLEARETPSGLEVTVLDLKTGARAASRPEAERHVQLQAYQLGVERNGFEVDGEPLSATSGGARLLYVHPSATGAAGFVERTQPPLGEEEREELVRRVGEIAPVLAAGEFTARVEHHCSDPHQPGSCRLHVIQAVSHA